MTAKSYDPYDLIIVGAGISGLSMAHYGAGRGWRVRVLEQADRTGGSLHTHRLNGTDFWLELGAHSGYNSYGNLLKIMEERELLQQIRGKARVRFQMFTDGRLQPVFAQLHWLELLVSLPRWFTEKKTGKSVAEYYGKVLGRKNYTGLFAPAFNAVICQPAGEFPADILFRPKPRRQEVIRSFTLPRGLQTLTETLAQRAGVTVQTDQSVQTVVFDKGGVTLTTAAGRCYQARYLCLATPVSTAAGLLKEPLPELAGLLERIRTVTVEAVGVTIRREVVPLPPLAGIIARNDSFYSVVSRDTVPDSLYRGFTFHFQPGLLDAEGKLRRISEVLGVQVEQFQDVASKANCLPALRVGHADLIREVDSQLAGKPLVLTGNYFTGVSLEDCVARSLKEFSRLQNELP
jgi:oxygen-dependent protoporphyrinogen oxidase